MMKFENVIEIDRPVDEVFAFVADFENVPRWNYFVTDVSKTSEGSIGAGTTFHQVRKIDQQDYRITEYEPPHRVTVETLPGSTPSFEMRYTFEGDGERTRLIDAWELDLGRSPLLQLLGKGRVKSAVAENLGKLKELLETGKTRLQDGRAARL